MKFLKLILTLLFWLTVFSLNAQWSQLFVPNTSTSFNSIYFKNTNEGYIAGGERIRKTTNGGVTWDTISYGNYWAYLGGCTVESIHFINSFEGIAAGWNFWDNCEIIFKTHDGGNTWDDITWGSPQAAFNTYLHDMFFVTATQGYCVGNFGHILYSSDGGDNWNYIASGTTNDLHGVFFIGNNGWIVGDEIIMKTNNLGSTWSMQSFPGEFFTDVFFTSSNVGFAVGNHIYKTTDGGLSWFQIVTSLNLDCSRIWASDPDTLYIANNGNILKSNNSGASWLPQYSIPNGITYESVYFLNPSFGLAGTGIGLVFRTTSGGDPVQANDAGVFSVNVPSNSCQGVLPVLARIKNYGASNLTSATINWELNGVSQAPYNWTGNLLPYDTSQQVTIGTAVFAPGTSTIKAYTTFANGSPELVHFNDTASSSPFFVRLSGEYTIGGTNPDFANITDAVTELNANGTCGNVIFKIRNGTYTGSITLTNYYQTNPGDSVTFQSESNDSTLVILSGVGYNLNLYSGTSNVIIKGMTLTSTNFSNVKLADDVSNFTLTNCVLSSPGTCVEQMGGVGTGIAITNNLFSNCLTGINITMSFNNPATELRITGNNIANASETGISVKYISNLIIDNNTVVTGTGVSYCIVIESCNSGFMVSNNNLMSNYGSVVYVKNCNNVANGEGYFVNNYFASVQNAVTSHAFFNYNSYYINLYNNSFNVEGNSVIRLYYTDTILDPNIELINNALVNRLPKYIFLLENSNNSVQYSFFDAIFNSISNNSYYQNTQNASGVYYFADVDGFGNIYNFNIWKNFFPSDTASVYADPQFTSLTDYHIYPNTSNYALSNRGIPIPNVNFDIDGDVRSLISPDIGADEFSTLALDAGVLHFEQSVQICAGVNNLSIKFSNYGNSLLTSATINYSINGVNQPSALWNGTLLSGDSATFQLPGSFNFIAGNTYLLKAWTSDPNGGVDLNTINDTITASIVAKGMSGTYTIGGVAPDFVTIQDAITNLINEGVCSSVIFNIRPGSYNESLTLPNITGTAYDKSITFRSETGDSTSVIIHYASGPPLTLDSTSYVVINSLSFGDGVDRGDVYLTNNSHHINFSNNQWNKSGPYRSISCDNKNSSYITIERNRFDSCYTAVSFYNNLNGIYSFGNEITDNVIYHPGYSAIQVAYATYIKISGNDIYNFYVGYNLQPMINVPYCNGKAEVLNNRISVRNAAVGMVINNSNGHYIEKSVVANNMVNIWGPGATGCYGVGLPFVRFVYNTGYLDSTSNSNSVVASLGNDAEIFNNNLYNKAGGYVVYGLYPDDPFVSDYNNFYTTGPRYFNSLLPPNNLAGWQIASGKDLNSISVVPSFNSSNDLHLNNDYYLDAAGIPLSYVLDDFDEEIRSSSQSDIGADEVYYPSIANDAGVRSIINPELVCSGNSQVQVKIKNYGSNNLTSATIHWSINGIGQPDFTWNGFLAPDSISNPISIGSYTFLAPDTFAISAWTSSPNSSIDNQVLNDTAKIPSFHTRLNGIYTIGGSNPDYIDIKAAKEALIYFGVCGPVTFNIRSGTYNQAFNPGKVFGVSSINTVLFQSEVGDSTQVTIGSVSLSENDYIYFSKLTTSAVTLTNQSDYNRISNCIVNGDITVTSCDHTFLDSNVINGRVKFTGTSSQTCYGNTMRDNVITTNYGVSYIYQDSILVERNSITNLNSFVTSNSYGIQLQGNSNGGSTFKVIKNRISGNFSHGIYSVLNGLPNDTGLIANNIIVSGSNNYSAVYLSCEYTKFVHNTCFVPSGNLYVCQNTIGPFEEGVVIMNNQFINYGSNVAYYWGAISSNTIVLNDYNNYFTMGSVLISIALNSNYASALDFNLAHPGFDANSTDVDPMFVSSTNLYPVNPLSQSTGTPIYGVDDDIDGNPRNSFTPTMGAIEIPCIASSSSISKTECGSYTSPSGLYNWNTSGIYNDTIPNVIGCDSIITINLTIIPLPIVTVTASGPVIFCRGDSVTLSANPGMVSYQWYRGNYLLPGATSSNYVAKYKGTYVCKSQDATLCYGWSNSITVEVPCTPIGSSHQKLNIQEEANSDYLTIDPNPGSGIFNLLSPQGTLQVFNSLGQLIYIEIVNEGIKVIDLNEFAEGIYHIKLINQNATYSSKLFLVR